MLPRSHVFAKCFLHSVSKPAYEPFKTAIIIGRWERCRKIVHFISDRSITSTAAFCSEIGKIPKPVEGKKTSTKLLEQKEEVLSSSASEPVQSAIALHGAAVLSATSTPSPDEKTSPKGNKEAVKDATTAPTKTAVKRQRARVDLSATSTERNFITPVRAMSDFLLKPNDLEDLRPSKRRSPFENEPPITVYWRKDVEAKAIERWGSLEEMEKEKLQRDLERKYHEQTIFTTKRKMREFRRDTTSHADTAMAQSSGLYSSSGRVVLTAVVINGSNFLFKLFAWIYTGSHSMFSETIHSLADTINQLILAFGIHKSVQRANQDHPYGYTNMKYVASLISGVGVFCMGTGLSVYHGITGLMSPEPIQSFYWAYFILAGSFVSEGATSLVAINSIKKGAREQGMTFGEYVWRGKDPSVNVVLLEDLAAVAGVMVAGVCMGCSSYFNSVVPDAIGSLLVGGILGAVASFIIYTNVAALVGRSIPENLLNRINSELESDVMIRAIYDVKGIDIGNCLIRYKAELDFDGRELTRSYLDKQDLNSLLEEIRSCNDIDQLEAYMIKHSEAIVDMMGGEIDRIEMKLRRKFPDIRHCDLEIL